MVHNARIRYVGSKISPDNFFRIGDREVVITFNIFNDNDDGTLGRYLVELLDTDNPSRLIRTYPIKSLFGFAIGRFFAGKYELGAGLGGKCKITSNLDAIWSLGDINNGFYLALYSDEDGELVKRSIIGPILIGAEGNVPVVPIVKTLDDEPGLAATTGNENPTDQPPEDVQDPEGDPNNPDDDIEPTDVLTADEFSQEVGGFQKAISAIGKTVKWVLIGGVIVLVGYGIFLASQRIRRKK